MVREKMYKEIQGYKQIGYTIRGCARELKMIEKRYENTGICGRINILNTLLTAANATK